MRSERELKAAATRALFAELWESGITKQSELVLRLGHSRRNVQRLSEEWKSGRMAEKIATDRVLAAAESGEPPSAPADLLAVAPPLTAVEDPGPGFDHMSVVRRICVSERSDPRDRIKAAEVAERRRQYDLEKGIGAGAKNLRLEDWLEMPFDTMPPQARPRWFGFLAQEMAAARTPWLSMPETTPEQVEVWHALGRQVAAEDAVELAVILRAARAMATTRADEMAAARAGPPADVEPVNPEDYLTHVPGGGQDDLALKARVRELTIRKEPGSAE